MHAARIPAESLPFVVRQIKVMVYITLYTIIRRKKKFSPPTSVKSKRIYYASPETYSLKL